jgi:hypothetical protein
MALAAAGGVAHAAFFAIFALRVIGRGGIGSVAWVLLALLAAIGLGSNFIGYYLVKHGAGTRARKWGYMAIALSSFLAGILLGIATWTA